jgi:phosphatidylinositol alpha-1,6-mannosyltransferase
MRARELQDAVAPTARSAESTLRTLLISGSYFPPQVGGISRIMEEICSQLGPDNAAVLTGVADGVVDERIRRLRVHRAAGMLRPRTPLGFARACLVLARVLERERPTLLQFATLEDAYLAYWTHRILRMRHILYVHGNEVLSTARSRWDKALAVLRASSYVVANSRYTERLLRDLAVPEERIRVNHPGCDLELFRPVTVSAEERARWLGQRHSGRALLTVGNLVERKGHDMVLRALRELTAMGHDVTYLIAGDGPYRGTLERLAANLGVHDRVLFLGRVATVDLPRLYALADVFVMVPRERADHSDVEGFGIVYIEAAACGKPSVAGRSGGVEDAVVDGVTGILVDPCDESELAAALATLLTQPALGQHLGEAGRVRAMREFGWNHYGNAVKALLRDAARS